MAKYTIGVEIGSTAVRAAKISGLDKDTFAIIDRFSNVDLPAGAVTAGAVRHPKVVAVALKTALADVGTRNSKIVLGITHPTAGLTRVPIPAAVKTPDRLKALATLGTQVSASLPINTTALATQQITKTENAEGNPVSLLAVAGIRQETLEHTLGICSAADVKPVAIDLSAAGLLRSLVRDTPSSLATTAIVDIGATQTTIIIRQGLRLRSVRGLQAGGLSLTETLAAAAKLSLEEAETRKEATQLVSHTQPEMVLGPDYTGTADEEAYEQKLNQKTVSEQALAAAVDHLVDQIALAIETDAEGEVRQVALCGGSSLLRGLKERLQRRLGVEVRIGRPWAHLANNNSNKPHIQDGIENPKTMLLLATAIGLGLWEPPE
ncbi:MAG: pilus assembly protein PilM [Acidimicrobiia bacterium]